jgi:hypothetical protein|tara:strand:- start:836 stop:1660 length:825 start_codon:yes stop_codon:yes gene_type:complete
MFGHDFYHESIRKYIILFGTMFNDIHIKRRNSNDNVIQKIKCPLTYAPREKVTARLEQNLSLTEQQSILLPRISFEMLTMTYDPSRKLNSVTKLMKDPNTGNNVKRIFNPVPYDINFDLNVYTRYAEDATQILEQIVPFFTPEFTATINLIPEMDIKVDVPIVLNSLSSQDVYEGDFETRRALIWNLSFNMRAYFYGPIKEQGVIKSVNTNFYTTHANGAYGNTPSTAVKQKPGLDQFRNPTTNGSITIAASGIFANDNYSVITDFEDYFDGGT